MKKIKKNKYYKIVGSLIGTKLNFRLLFKVVRDSAELLLILFNKYFNIISDAFFYNLYSYVNTSKARLN